MTPSDGAIRSVTATICSEHSRGNGDGRADQQSAKRELERGGITLEDDAAHGGLKLEGLPKVYGEKVRQIVAVLNEEGLIEIQCVPQLRNFPGRGAFAEHLLDRIAGNDVNHQENQGENEPERRESQKKALQEVSAPSASVRRGIGSRRFGRFHGLGFVRRRRGHSSLSRTITRGARALNFYAGDALAVHFDDREAVVSVLKTFAAARNEAELVENETTHRGIGGIFRKRDVVLGIEVADIQRRIENDSAIGEGKRALHDVKFVVNFSHDLLQDVL